MNGVRIVGIAGGSGSGKTTIVSRITEIVRDYALVPQDMKKLAQADVLVINGLGMPRRPENALADLTKTVEAEPFAVIPHDVKLFGSAANNGQMIAEIEPKGKVAETFGELAAKLAGRAEARAAKRGLFDPFLAKLMGKTG